MAHWYHAHVAVTNIRRWTARSLWQKVVGEEGKLVGDKYAMFLNCNQLFWETPAIPVRFLSKPSGQTCCCTSALSPMNMKILQESVGTQLLVSTSFPNISFSSLVEEMAAKFAASIEAKTLVLTHFGKKFEESNQDQVILQSASRIFKNKVVLAEDFMKIPVTKHEMNTA
jgi:hypothetical protein